MERSPRKPEERLFSRKTLLLSFLQGASVLLIVVGVFIVARLRGEPETNVRALALTTLIIVTSNDVTPTPNPSCLWLKRLCWFLFT